MSWYFTQTLQIDGFLWYKEKQWFSFSIHKVILTFLGGGGVFFRARCILFSTSIGIGIAIHFISVVNNPHTGIVLSIYVLTVIWVVISTTSLTYSIYTSYKYNCWLSFCGPLSCRLLMLWSAEIFAVLLITVFWYVSPNDLRWSQLQNVSENIVIQHTLCNAVRLSAIMCLIGRRNMLILLLTLMINE